MVAAAFPYIQVTINTSALLPVAQRAPGVIALVGVSNAGSAAVNVPKEVSDANDAAGLFASRDANGAVVPTPLYSSLVTAFQQDPLPQKVYGVKVAADGFVAGLAALEGLDDITFVGLAATTTIGAAATNNAPATGLMALKDHVERTSAAGSRRIAVAMVDPTRARATDYVSKVISDYAPLKSDTSRMVLVAARNASSDLAAAAMAAIAGYQPHVSILLKQLRGVSIPLEAQYSATEIKQLSEANIIPIIDPSLIPGTGLYFGEGRAFTSDETKLYVDVVRTLDDIEFKLKAGLIGLVGDARITKSGMVRLKTRIEGVLEPLERADVIAGFEVQIPVLDIVSRPESTWTAGDQATVVNARSSRTIDVQIAVTYGPAVHRLNVTLAMKF
jgi:hypothetical protein